MADYWSERSTGQSRQLQDWRRDWAEAVYQDELELRGWPDSWRLFVKRCLLPDDGSLPKLRKRRPGGGRKPKPDKLIIRQICLTREQAEAVKQASLAAGVSQSGWIREAIAARLAEQS